MIFCVQYSDLDLILNINNTRYLKIIIKPAKPHVANWEQPCGNQ